MKLTATVIDKTTKYCRFVDKKGLIYWQKDLLLIQEPSEAVRLEKIYIQEVTHKPAIHYVRSLGRSLEYDFERSEEMHYNESAIEVYDAYIAGYMAAYSQSLKPIEIVK